MPKQKQVMDILTVKRVKMSAMIRTQVVSRLQKEKQMQRSSQEL